MSELVGEHVVCLGCGRTAIGKQGDPTDVGPSRHCSHCPPWPCEDCGETCSSETLCSCWISLRGLPLADIKGLLALGDLSVTTPTAAEDES